MGKRTSRRRRKSLNGSLLGIAVALVGGLLVIGAAAEHPLVALEVALIVITLLLAWFWWKARAQRRRDAFYAAKAQHLGDILLGSGGEFETVIGSLFRTLGYRDVERIGGSGDLGVDLKAMAPDGEVVIIQCKRYGGGNKIGSPAIQNLMGAVVNNGADRGIFITTSSFTAPAIQHAQSARVAIDLIDGDELTRLAARTTS